MRKLFVLNLIALLILSMALPGMSVFADDIIVIDFDDLVGQAPIPEGYAGLNWDPEWFYWDWGQSPYTPESGLTRIATHNYGGYIDFSPLGYDVVFHGAYISGRSDTSVYLEGHKDGEVVWTSDTITPSSTPYLLGSGNPEEIDKVVLVSSLFNYFSLDTLMYSAPESVMDVMIDIKPGSEMNALQPKSKGVLPVALLGSDDFDVMTVDPASLVLTMEGTEMEVMPLRWAFEDVEYMDGMTDIIIHFKTSEVMALLGEDPEGEIELMLMGETMDGMPFMGMDSVMIVPPQK